MRSGRHGAYECDNEGPETELCVTCGATEALAAATFALLAFPMRVETLQAAVCRLEKLVG